MRPLLGLLLLVVLPSFCDAQLFRRRYRECPDGYCQPYQRPLPVIPIEEQKKPIDFVDITNDTVVKNVGGNCVWATAEAMLLAAGYDEAKGLRDQAVKNGWNGAWITQLAKVLDNAKIQYKISQNGDMSIFDYARQEGVPVYVQIAVNRPEDHAVEVVGMDATTVRIIDPNATSQIQTWSMEKFKRCWGGRALCPLFRKHRKKKDEDQAKPIVDAKPCNCKPVDFGPVEARLVALETAAKTPAKVDLTQVNTAINQLTVNAEKQLQISSNLTTHVNEMVKSVNSLNERVTKLEQKAGIESPKILSRIEQVKP